MERSTTVSKKTPAQGFTIPWETADQITLASLLDHRDTLKQELKKFKKNPRTDDNPGGHWLHPEDVVTNTMLIQHMNAIIHYYGGD